MELSKQFQLHGKTALITGSSQGIGKGIALGLAENGANIILHCRDDQKEARQVAEEISRYGVKTSIISADLSTTEGVKFLCDHAAAGPQPDIVILNASVQIPRLWEEITLEDFDAQVNTNFRSTFQLIQHFAPKLVEKQWGRIVTIGSVQQIKPHPAMMIYAATKSAVLNIVQNFAMQLADKGVTVNNIAPGVVGTQRLEQDVPETDERIHKRLETPSGQIGDLQDCAAMAALLCSEAGRFITGQNIFVDGGMSL